MAVHVFLAVSQIGLFPWQSVLAVHPTHCPTAVSQT
jgi:hypothetical protein